MWKSVVCAALLLVGGAGFALPVPHVAAHDLASSFDARFQREFQGVDLAAPLGSRMLATPGGTLVAERITGQEFLEDVHVALGRVPGASAEAAALPEAVATGDPALSSRTKWPYCDVASMFVEWSAPGPPEPGSVVTQAQLSPLQHSLGQDCSVLGFGDQPTKTWETLTFDTSALPAGTLATLCVAAQVFPTATQEVGTLGGYACGFEAASLHGNAALDQEEFCYAGTCEGLAYALGAGDVIHAGGSEAGIA